MSATEPAATEAATLTPPATAATSDLALTPPEAVAAVAPDKAGGMVPIDPQALPALDDKVSEYVDAILELDVHSAAFTAKAGDVRAMGDDDIRASAEMSNRLLSSPVRAMQRGQTGKVATHARRAPPHRRRPRPGGSQRRQEAARVDPLRRQAHRLLPQVRERTEASRRDRRSVVRRPGRAAQGQRRARAGEGASLGDDAAARPVHLHRAASRRVAGGQDRRRSKPPTPRRRKRSATTCCSTCARSTRTC